MNSKYTTYAMFYGLALVYWLVAGNMEQSTLLCVFYSVFVGTVWGLLPKVSFTEPLSWKHLLPPFMLTLLMMFSARLRMMPSAEVIMLTSMALLHLRASLLSFARLRQRARLFSIFQLVQFGIGIAYIFQKNLLPFSLDRSFFFILMMGLGTLSIGMLLTMRGKPIETDAPEIEHD